MTVDDSAMDITPRSDSHEKLPSSDEPLKRIHSGPSRVPFDHFARSDSVLHLPPSLDDDPEAQNDPKGNSGAVSAIETLVGDDFRFDKFLQDKWDRAAQAGIDCRDTGVVFKVCSSYPVLPHRDTDAAQDLRVVGLGAAAKYQDTILSILNPLQLLDAIQNVRHPPVKNILSGFEGVVRPGEMLLVLGRPGSGCSSFLKVLANQRAGFHSVEGQVSYDGITPEYMAKHYRGDIGYSPEDDIHFPSLTVRQTLNVSTATRAPRTRLGDSRPEYIDAVVDALGTVFGLTHAYNTPVGDENIRGVSGGEKKRVSIAEMMSMRVALACWDK
jgi:ATP-binding cassette subfamily G (WHITE) protein 2 (SNQ2)